MAGKPNKWTRLYEGQIEEWRIRLAIDRLKVFRIPRRHWADMLQDLYIVMTQFKYEPSKSNGAQESTALCTVINRQIRNKVRAWGREQERIERYKKRILETCPVIIEGEDMGYIDTTPLRVDVRDALERLTPFERAVCEGLSNDQSANRIAQELGVSWHKAKHTIDVIRSFFAIIGLEGWMCR